MERLGQDWLVDGEARYHSPRTKEIRTTALRNLAWFVRNRYDLFEGTSPDEKAKEKVVINAQVMRAFLAYLRKEDPQGKWGSRNIAGKALHTKGLKARSVATYDNHLRSFFRWLEKQGEITANPMDKIESTVVRRDHIEIFSDEQMGALFLAAHKTLTSRRDIALFRFILDTCCRVDELCKIKVGDLDMDNRSVTLHGKGNKTRRVSFGRQTHRCLYKYLSDGQKRDDGIPPRPDEPLFRSVKGRCPGSAMTPSGVLDAMKTMGRIAGLSGVRVSPHTLRHTGATKLLEQGVPMVSVRDILGHTDIRQTEIYAHIAESKTGIYQRDCSPVDKLGL